MTEMDRITGDLDRYWAWVVEREPARRGEAFHFLMSWTHANRVDWWRGYEPPADGFTPPYEGD